MNFDYSPHLKKALNDDIKALEEATSFSRTLNDTDERKEYVAREKKVTDFMHHGQRKLLMSEIEFITTEYHKFKPNGKKILLYIGASTGQTSVHTYTLAKLFPEIEFHLWDNNKKLPDKLKFYKKLYKFKNDKGVDIGLNAVDIPVGSYGDKVKARIKIFKRWFSDEDTKYYKNKNVLLVSDLRNPDIKDTSDSQKSNQLILDDLKLQSDFFIDIKPVSALFKFRLPWDNNKTKYLDGDIYLQAWETLRSTETRLIPKGWEGKKSGEPKMKEYDDLIYEQQMFYFNTETRFRYYQHKYKCYGHCFDCRSEIDILEKYIKLKKINTCVCKIGKQISDELGKPIFKEPLLNKCQL